jgi:hypothetical protein
MRGVDVAAGVAALALVGSLCSAAPSHAYSGGGLNGTYQVMSDGEWARGVRDILYDQQTVTETWTVNTTCVSPIECSGTVSSSLGWTGAVRLDDFWYIDHDVPNWIPCPDGSFAPGHQKFILKAIDPATNESRLSNISFLMGRNLTRGASGACGVNAPLSIEMPVKAVKLS